MKPGQVYTNTSTASISLIHRVSCPWGCTPVFVLDNPRLISSEEFLIFHSLFGPPKWSVFLTDFHVVWKKASFSLFCTSCQKKLFCSSNFCVVRNNDQHSLFTFPIWDWSASQWDLWLYRSLPYPSQCLSEGCSSYLICLFTSAVNTAFFGVPRLFELRNIAVYSKPETLFMWVVSVLYSLGPSTVYESKRIFYLSMNINLLEWGFVTALHP